jgi:hypothetical protein
LGKGEARAGFGPFVLLAKCALLGSRNPSPFEGFLAPAEQGTERCSRNPSPFQRLDETFIYLGASAVKILWFCYKSSAVYFQTGGIYLPFTEKWPFFASHLLLCVKRLPKKTIITD